MDHMMPVMDGIETTARIRAFSEKNDPYYKNLPIIALTANAVSGMKEMFLNNGFNDFISKPIDTGKLNSALEKWIPKEKQKWQQFVKRRIYYEAPEVVNGIDLQIEGLDTTIGVSMTGGSKKDYLRVLSIFYDDGLEKIVEIKTCIEKDDLPLITTYTHALKNVCAIIGAVKLSDIAKDLESAGARNDSAYIKEHCPDFLYELDKLLKSISKALPEPVMEKIIGHEDIEVLIGTLEEFKVALSKFDPEPIQKIAVFLQNSEFDAKTVFSISGILHKKLIGEYEDAVILIDRLLEELKAR